MRNQHEVYWETGADTIKTGDRVARRFVARALGRSGDPIRVVDEHVEGKCAAGAGGNLVGRARAVAGKVAELRALDQRASQFVAGSQFVGIDDAAYLTPAQIAGRRMNALKL